MEQNINYDKVLDEVQTRRNLIHFAYNRGGNVMVQELLQMMQKMEDLLKKCKNETELNHMRVLFISQIYKFLDLEGSLSVGNQVIFDEKK